MAELILTEFEGGGGESSHEKGIVSIDFEVARELILTAGSDNKMIVWNWKRIMLY